jgi:xanthine/uracil permease
MKSYSNAIVSLIYFGLLFFLDMKALDYLTKDMAGIFLGLVVIQIGLGLIFVALTVDQDTGKNKAPKLRP